MAKRFGINYIICNRQQWRAYDPGRGWAPYYGVSPHTDHIHFSFNWDGAYKRTSWWSGVAVTTPLTGPDRLDDGPPAPTRHRPITASGYPLLAQGATGADVVLAQKVIGVTADGKFGPLTAAALGTWQTKRGVPATKKLDNPTWATMVSLKLVPAAHQPAVAVRQRRAQARLDGHGRQGPAEGHRQAHRRRLVRPGHRGPGQGVPEVQGPHRHRRRRHARSGTPSWARRGPGPRADPDADPRPAAPRQPTTHPLAKYSTSP